MKVNKNDEPKGEAAQSRLQRGRRKYPRKMEQKAHYKKGRWEYGM